MNKTTETTQNGEPTANWYPHSRVDSGTYMKIGIDAAVKVKNSFFTHSEQKLHKQPLININRLIRWDDFSESLAGIYGHEVAKIGSFVPYDAVAMFKLILVGGWHQLSDVELEHALSVRIDFILFCGFDTSLPLPDSATICGFRSLLKASHLEENLSNQVQTQLEVLGLRVQGVYGAVIDATIIANRDQVSTAR